MARMQHRPSPKQLSTLSQVHIPKFKIICTHQFLVSSTRIADQCQSKGVFLFSLNTKNLPKLFREKHPRVKA